MTGDEYLAAILAELRIANEWLKGLAGMRPVGAAPTSARTVAPADGEPVFPNYGRSKGLPVRGATRGDLEYYAAGAQRSLDDPAKARWHGKERVLLDAINAELRRQSGGQMAEPPEDFGTDSEAPF